jgi:hypothetical protein
LKTPEQRLYYRKNSAERIDCLTLTRGGIRAEEIIFHRISEKNERQLKITNFHRERHDMKKTSKTVVGTAFFLTAAITAASCASEPAAPPPFEPTMESLEANFRTPEWYKDAKFGIFAHWGPQCEPESGDWYARNMYIPNEWQFRRHLEKYGDQKKTGFKDIIHMWKAEK